MQLSFFSLKSELASVSAADAAAATTMVVVECYEERFLSDNTSRYGFVVVVVGVVSVVPQQLSGLGKSTTDKHIT